jgi:hypothetical protein
VVLYRDVLLRSASGIGSQSVGTHQCIKDVGEMVSTDPS